MSFDRVIILKIRIGKSGTRIDESDLLIVSVGHLIIVHHYASNLHPEVFIFVQNVDPLESLFIRIQEVPRRIIPTHLEVAAVLTEAQRELLLLDNVLIEHRFIDRLVKVIILRDTLLAQS